MKFGLREVAFTALLGAIPIAAWLLVFRPHDARCAQLTEKIEAHQAKLRKLNQLTGRIGDLEAEITEQKQALAYFRARLPSAKEIDKVIQEIWRLARANDLTTTSIRTPRRQDDAEGTVGPQAHAISVELVGDFRGFYAFLQALENQPRITRLREMEVEKADSKEMPEGHVAVTFEMTVFFESAEAKP
ncbi:MAG: type 4a pilus biogenesis protein PilO [Phycisphaerae bacterium]|nr:type 4a pilus biogenesis protein PilO [Phycisphaerae bacterium]